MMNDAAGKELDRHVRYYVALLHKTIDDTWVTMHHNKCQPNDIGRLRSLCTRPVHYDISSEPYFFNYVYTGCETDVCNPCKMVALSEMVRKAVCVFKEVCLVEDGIQWNAVYFDIMRDEKGVYFNATMCLYVQTLDDRIDEMIDELRSLKGSPHDIVENCLLRNVHDFLQYSK